jgi:hypothetical protein
LLHALPSRRAPREALTPIPPAAIIAKLFAAIIAKLLGVILDPARLDAIEAEIERRLAAERSSGADKKIRAQIETLDKNITQGNTNLALLPHDRLPGVIERIRTWEKERDGLNARLNELAGGDVHGLREQQRGMMSVATTGGGGSTDEHRFPEPHFHGLREQQRGMMTFRDFLPLSGR